MTTDLRDILLDLDRATIDAECAAITMQVLANSFFPTGPNDYPIWAWDTDATAFQRVADDTRVSIDRVQKLVQAAFAAEREVPS